MAESQAGSFFINSEQVGDYVTVTLPAGAQPEGAQKGGEGEQIRLHYLESGVGEPLLLIHGIGQSLYTWRNVFADLSDNYRVLAIDLPGHGYSSRPERFAYSMDEMADVLHAFLVEKGIASAHMMGFSTGAVYMMRLLTRYPECVANCIAIAPGGISRHMPRLFHRMKNSVLAVFSRNLFSAGDVRHMLDECVFDKTTITERDVKQYYAPISDGLSREALMYAVTNFDMKGTADALRSLDHEILCVWGREDRWHPPSGSVYFQGILQNGRYYMIRNTGHLVQEENPAKLLEVVFSYIPPAVPSYQAYTYTDYTSGDA